MARDWDVKSRPAISDSCVKCDEDDDDLNGSTDDDELIVPLTTSTHPGATAMRPLGNTQPSRFIVGLALFLTVFIWFVGHDDERAYKAVPCDVSLHTNGLTEDPSEHAIDIHNQAANVTLHDRKCSCFQKPRICCQRKVL